MGKIFTDDRKFNKPWFRKLPPKYKCFWDLICDTSNIVGIWDVDEESASFLIGESINLNESLNLFNNGKKRIHVMSKEKWLILEYISFQNKGMIPANDMGNKMLDLIGKYKIFDLIKPYLKPIPMEEDGKARKRRSAKAMPNTVELVKYFYRKWQEFHGKSYIADWGKDGHIFKELQKTDLSCEEIKGLIDSFVCSRDTWICRTGKTVAIFRQSINKFRQNPSNVNLTTLQSIKRLKEKWSDEKKAV